MTRSNNSACIDDANNCLVQGTNQVAISNSGRLTLVNGQYGTRGTAFTTFTQNISASTIWNSSFNFGLVYANWAPQANGFAFGMQNSAGVGFRSWVNNDVFVVANGVSPRAGDPLTNWGASQLVAGSVSMSASRPARG